MFMLTVSMDQVSCNFSSETFCDWLPVGGDVVWVLRDFISDTHAVGPIADHTAGTPDVFLVNRTELNYFILLLVYIK